MGKRPICLKCEYLVWQGFLAHCVNTLIDDLSEDAEELSHAESEEQVAVIEQQDLRFERSLADQLMSIPYIAWKRKVKYYEFAPKRRKDCPFKGILIRKA